MTEHQKSKFDWDAVRRRLAHSESALSDTMAANPERIRELYNLRAAQLAKRRLAATSTLGALVVLAFRIGKESYGIDLTGLAEILAYENCTPVPGGLPALLGLINVRGEICPVFDLARLLELEHDGPRIGAGYVLMVRVDGAVIGLRVDQIDDVRDLRRDEIAFTKEDTAELASHHVKGITQDTLILIDVRSLVQQFVPAGDKREQEQLS